MDTKYDKQSTGDQFTHQQTTATLASSTMDNAVNKRHVLHASNNNNIQQLKPTSTPDNQTICKQRRPQEPQVAAESNQNEARATRRVAAEQAQYCAVEDGEKSPAATARPPVVVLRRCEDLHIRTSGFQKIEEDSQRRPMDLRRQHKLLEQQQQQRMS